MQDTIGYDVETGLFYCNSRYYSPELCRWISPDSIEYLDPESINGLNLYCYCGNDPIDKVDPTGHDWWHWAVAAGIVVVLAAILVATAGGAVLIIVPQSPFVATSSNEDDVPSAYIADPANASDEPTNA